MTRMTGMAIFCAWASLTSIAAGQTASAHAPAGETAGETVVLNSDSPLRAFMVFQTPVVISASGELRTALDPIEKELKPVTIHAARNSVFSGRLAVSSDRTIDGLKVTVSELRQSGGRGVPPASAVRVRYAEPAVAGKSWVPPQRFDGLLDAVPARVPVRFSGGGVWNGKKRHLCWTTGPYCALNGRWLHKNRA